MNKLFPILLAMLVLITYFDASENTFHLDDHRNIVEIRAVHIQEVSLDSLSSVVSGALLSSRVIPNITFALDWLRGDGKPEAFLWTNICIHILTALVLYYFLMQVLTRCGFSGDKLYFAAFSAALIWAVHPIQTQAVTYIVQRMAELSTLFVLITVYLYIEARRAESKKRKIALFSLALIAFVAGVISKENALITPILILLAEYGVCRGPSKWRLGRWDIVVMLLPVISLLYVIIDLVFGAGPITEYIKDAYARRDFAMVERLLTQPRVIVFHFYQLVWPVPENFSIEHGFEKSTSLLKPVETILAIIALFLWIAIGLFAMLKKSWRGYGFFMLWVPATLVIESSFIPLEMVFEHRMYMPLIGVAGLWAMTVAWLLTRGETMVISVVSITVSISILLMLSSMIRLEAWKTPLSLYQSAIPHAPNSARVWGNLGKYLMAEGNEEAAVNALKKALVLDPDNVPILVNFAIYERSKGNYLKSIDYLNRAIELRPEYSRAYYERGYVNYEYGKFDLALRDLSKTIKLNPQYSAYVARGRVYLKMKDYQHSLGDYYQALQIAPDAGVIYADRGDVYLILGDYPLAVADYTRSIELGIDHANIYWSLATAQVRLGRRAEAAKNYSDSCNRVDRPGCRNIERLIITN